MKNEETPITKPRVNHNCRTLCSECIFFNKNKNDRSHCNCNSTIGIDPVYGIETLGRVNNDECRIAILNADLNCQKYVPARYVGADATAKVKDKVGIAMAIFTILSIASKIFRR